MKPPHFWRCVGLAGFMKCGNWVVEVEASAYLWCQKSFFSFVSASLFKPHGYISLMFAATSFYLFLRLSSLILCPLFCGSSEGLTDSSVPPSQKPVQHDLDLFPPALLNLQHKPVFKLHPLTSSLVSCPKLTFWLCDNALWTGAGASSLFQQKHEPLLLLHMWFQLYFPLSSS